MSRAWIAPVLSPKVETLKNTEKHPKRFLKAYIAFGRETLKSAHAICCLCGLQFLPTAWRLCPEGVQTAEGVKG